MQSTAAPPLPLPSPRTPKIPCNVHICAGMGGVGSEGRWGRVPGAELRLQVAVHVGGGLVPQHKVVAVEGNQAVLVHTRDSGSRPPPWLSFNWNPIP